MIVSTKKVLWGVPRIEGTRLSVYNIVSSLWQEPILENLIEDSNVELMKIKEALIYCKELKCQKLDALNFCDGCILRTIKDGDFKKRNYKKISDNIFKDENGNKYLANSIRDIENEEFGYLGWDRAEILYNMFWE